jgi:hypothetical protein
VKPATSQACDSAKRQSLAAFVWLEFARGTLTRM